MTASVDTILDFAERVSPSSLSSQAIHASRVFLGDAIGVAIAGSTEPDAERVRKAASGWGSGAAATVLGTRERLPPAAGAFVNSFQVHCQEFDPLHEPATVHAMAVLTGALLAIAEREATSGDELLAATALGVEIAVVLGLAAKEGLRFFRPATAGALGTTVALARLLRLERSQALNALGLAYSQLAGTMQAHVEGSAALPIQIAHAARAAVTAVDLANAGIDGPHDILNGPFGYFELYEHNGDIGPLLATLGRPWRVTELSHKPFPTGRAAHAMLDAARQLQAQVGFRLQDIESVQVTVPPLVRRLVGRPPLAGMSVNYARLCLAFLMARLLRDGEINTATFHRLVMDDPDLIGFGTRLGFVEDPGHGNDVLSPQSIRIMLTNEKSYAMDVPHTLGSPLNPLDAAGREAKFRQCATSAGVEAGPLLSALEGLGKRDSVRDLLALTVPPG